MDSGLTSYKSALERLFARTGSTANFGLDRTRALLALLDNPHEKFKSFHIAGTNGKGSVVATAEALLRAKGLRVGSYTSPHLVDFRERFVVDGAQISEDKVESFLNRWEGESERLGATFFEITTALAFTHFASREVDVALIETGLGGRLDSTNVITPLVAAVTSIGIDHTEYLGSTIREIAREKGGIFKRGVPAIYGRVSTEAHETLTAVARSAGADPIIAAEDLYHPGNVRVTRDGTEFEVDNRGNSATVRTGLIGAPQAHNTCVALAMLDAAGEPYRATLAEARTTLPTVALAGRFQRIGKLILDVAHNPDGIRTLVDSLDAVAPPRPIVAVLGVLRDKDWREMMKILCPSVDRAILTSPPSAPAARAWNPAEAEQYGNENGWNVKRVEDIGAAVNEASSSGATVIVTGSFHTVGDALLVQ